MPFLFYTEGDGEGETCWFILCSSCLSNFLTLLFRCVMFDVVLFMKAINAVTSAEC